MARIVSRLILDQTENGIEAHSHRPFLRFFWRRDAIRRRYATLADALLGLSELYLQVAKKGGAAGRKQRRRLATKIAQGLVG
jgi:hypothetical protein